MNDPTERWLLSNLKLAFSLGGPDSGALLTAPHGLRTLKALSEISYFALYGSFEVSSELLTSLKTLLAPILTSSSFFSLMRFNTDYAPLFLSLCDVGLKLNVLDGSSYDSVQKLCRILFEMGPERVPFRQLDLLYGLRNLGFNVDQSLQRGVLSTGCLMSLHRVRNIQANDAYALTHNIFYLTDFGRQAMDLEPSIVEESKLALKRLAYIAVAEDNMDLLSEYVLCFGYLNAVNHDVIAFSDEIRSRKQVGSYWHGPVRMEGALGRLHIPPALYSFYSNYHTTLLAWQATKVNGRIVRQMQTRVVPTRTTGGDAIVHACVISDVEAIVAGSSSASSDFAFVIWVANRLGFGLGELIDDMARNLSEVSPDHSPLIENLRLITGHDPVNGRENPSLNFATFDELWEYSRWLSNQEPRSRARSIEARLCRAYEHNRSIYIRLLALGLALDIFSITELRRELSYVDSLYSPGGQFLWREQRKDVDVEIANTALVGKLMLAALARHTEAI
jgi:hypothetical protein